MMKTPAVFLLFALTGCATATREQVSTHRTTRYDGHVSVPLPTAQGIKPTQVPVHLVVEEDSDEDRQREDETKPPAWAAPLLASLAEKSANAVVPGSGSLLSAVAGAVSPSGGLGDVLSLVLGGSTVAGAGLVALKQRQLKVQRKAIEDAVAYAQDAEALDPKDDKALKALRAEHRMKQIARGTNDVIKEHL